MQNKDSRYLGTTKNLYSSHAFEYPPGNQHIPNEHYGNSSYAVTHNPNMSQYTRSNMAGVPYEDGSVHGHFIPSQENSFMNHNEMNSERKTSVGQYQNSYPSDHGACHSQVMSTQMTNVPSENVHSQMSPNVNMIQAPHQPSNANMIPSHQQNRQFPAHPSNSWGHYQELQPRVQNMHHHHHNQQNHFLAVSPTDQYSHESSNSNNLFDSAAIRTNNNFHFPPPPAVPNTNEGQNMQNPLQSLQDMVMLDGSEQQKCPAANSVIDEQCSVEYEKSTSTYLTTDEYQNCLPSSNEAAVMFLSPPPSSGESVAVPVVADVTEQQSMLNPQNSAMKECSQEDAKFEIVSKSLQIIDNVEEVDTSHSIESDALFQNVEKNAVPADFSKMYVDAVVDDDDETYNKKETQSCENVYEVDSSTPAVDTDLKTVSSDDVKKELSDDKDEETVGQNTDFADLKQSNDKQVADVCTTQNSCKTENTSDEREANSNVDQNSLKSDSTIEDTVNTYEIDLKSQQRLDSSPKAICVLSTEGLDMSCHEHTPCENAEELMSSNLEVEEFENEVCSTLSSDVVDGSVLSVKAKTLRKTVRSVKLKNLKRLKNFSRNNHQALLAVSKPGCESNVAKNPVRVVIHRIKADSAKETWRIPKSDEKLKDDHKGINGDIKSKSPTNISKSGPQIIILSPAVSRKKKGKATCKPKALFPSDSKSSAANIVSVDGTACVSNENPDQNANVSINEPPASVVTKKSVPVKKRRRTQKLTSSKTKKKKTLKNKKFQKNQENSKGIQKVKKITKRFSGPYIHMIDSSNITIVNVIKGEEKDKKPVQTKTAESGFSKRPQVGHTSTLSPNYDAFNVDRTWTCIFCNKGSHTNGLGDLFGPYYVKESAFGGESMSKEKSRQTGKKVNAKRKRTDISESCKRNFAKKAKQCGKAAPSNRQSDSPNVMDLEKEMSSFIKEQEDCAKKEIWIHEDCAVWCQTISIVGQYVHGLEEAVQESRDCVCTVCKVNGATMGCWNKGCSERYHFACALQKGCEIDVEKFALFCSQHKKGKPTERLKPK